MKIGPHLPKLLTNTWPPFWDTVYKTNTWWQAPHASLQGAATWRIQLHDPRLTAIVRLFCKFIAIQTLLQSYEVAEVFVTNKHKRSKTISRRLSAGDVIIWHRNKLWDLLELYIKLRDFYTLKAKLYMKFNLTNIHCVQKKNNFVLLHNS